MRPDPAPVRLPPWHPVVLRRTWRRHRVAAVGAPVVVAAAAAMSLQATMAAFDYSTSTGLNTFEAGTVALTAGDPAQAVFDVDDMLPGTSVSRCVVVSFTGDVAADTRMFVTGVGGAGGLADHLDLTVTTGGGADPSCGDFVPGSALLPATTLATVADQHDGFASGLGPWSADPGEDLTYRVTVRLPEAAPSQAQGLDTTATFVWEARSTAE